MGYDWDAHRADVATAKPEPYRNEPMTRERAYDVAIAFGLLVRKPIQPRPNGLGWDATIPMEVLEMALERCGDIPPRQHFSAEDLDPPPYVDFAP